jgi:protein O-GlcNAc transferase
MPIMPVSQAIELALQHHRAGRLAQAERVYRHVLEQQPNNSDAVHYLGLLSLQLGRRKDAAIELMNQSIALNPVAAAYHHNLGTVWLAEGRLDQALACLRQAIQLQPDYPEAHVKCGRILHTQGQLDQAIECYQKAVELQPDIDELTRRAWPGPDGKRPLG